MARYIDVDALWRDVTSNIEDCGDVLEIIERQPVVTINSTAEEIKVTNCNHNADDSKFERTINASDLQEWIMNAFPDWCEGAVRVIYDHIDEMPSAQPNLQPTCNQLATDCISRHDAIDALDDIETEVADGFGFQYEKWRKHFTDLPSAQPEPAIPLSWIDAKIEWLKSLDNEFSILTAGQISAMVNMWKGEQNERYD